MSLPECAPQTNGDVLLAPEQLRAVQQVLENPARTNRIVAARVCNHGRYIDARGDKVDVVDVGNSLGNLRGGIKPRFWMEGGTHELWPNSGGRGYSGWPGVTSSNSQVPPLWTPLTPLYFKDGKVHELFGFPISSRSPWILPDHSYRISYDFGAGEFAFGFNEHKISRGHHGNMGTYITHSIPNLGEEEKELSKSAELVLRYRGLWGGWWNGNQSPEGPWKDEMWVGADSSKPDARKAAQIDPRMRR